MDKNVTSTEDQTASDVSAVGAMDDLLQSSDMLYGLPKQDEVIKATVTAADKSHIWVDVEGRAIGLISGRELHDGLGTAESLKPGDSVEAYVVEPEDEDGYVILSLRRAGREKVWLDLEEKLTQELVLALPVLEANKGGLIMELNGIRGFLPVSQLSPEHYPRVGSNNASEIYNRLNQLVGTPLNVRLLTVEKDNNKVIFSEKLALANERKALLERYHVGDIVPGTVTGIINFGVFIDLGGLEGLVHISEIAWDRVTDPNLYTKIGEKRDVKIIGLDNDRISLSFKRIEGDPWTDNASKYTVGDIVSVTVTRLTPFGAFAQLDPIISGLIHISEMSHTHVVDPADIVEVGQKLEVKIISLELEQHRLGLSLKALEKKEPDTSKVAVAASGTSAKTPITDVPGVSADLAGKLQSGGIETLAQLAAIANADLEEIKGIGPATAKKLKNLVAEL